jgi:predicted ATPase
VLPAIASVIGATGDLGAYLAGKRMLLLLDNLEQVIECASDLAALAASTLHLRLLVTSRQPLRVGGECEIHVEPLDEEHSVALFLERARSIDPSVEPSGLVAEICRRLDHLPLAVELAAARVRVLSLEALLERLDERLPLLTGGRRDAPERQGTLRATIAWTYDLLDERERDAFTHLGVFHGGWLLEAAEEVTGVDLGSWRSR